MICETCGEDCVGFYGPPICSDCAFPALKKASEAAVKAVSDRHFERTGERVSGNKLLFDELMTLGTTK